MSKKKLLFWCVSRAKKFVHLRLIPKNEKVKKSLIYLSFWAWQLVMFEFRTSGKKLFFLATLLGFPCFWGMRNELWFSFVFFVTNSKIKVQEEDVWKLQHCFEKRAANHHENAFYLQKRVRGERVLQAVFRTEVSTVFFFQRALVTSDRPSGGSPDPSVCPTGGTQRLSFGGDYTVVWFDLK